jgi:hypothetical protein
VPGPASGRYQGNVSRELAPRWGTVTAMSDDHLTTGQRVVAIEGIEKYVAELSGLASWLADHGADAASILAEDAVRNLCAAG